jgi:hypothetical protein
MDKNNEMLRHTVATLAYRAGKALRGAPPEFASFRAGDGSRTPAEILSHMGDLFDWALTMTDGKPQWRSAEPMPWNESLARLFRLLDTFDRRLASDVPLSHPPQQVFQGPIADALTHTGQIAMLRRLAGCPVRGESYFQADIVTGRTGAEQSPPKFEFD